VEELRFSGTVEPRDAPDPELWNQLDSVSAKDAVARWEHFFP